VEAAAVDEMSDGSIRIRLKYLNDEQKLVQGRLTEALGDFKRYFYLFRSELEKKLNLIFTGDILIWN
jgi:transmembrane and ubiquitin-like domain-containing protein